MVYSFLLTFFAGFSTLLGYFFIFIKSKNINRFISYCLSLVIGVMLSLSVFELIPESYSFFIKQHLYFQSILLIIIFFLIGIILSLIIEKIFDNKNNLYKIGIVSMVAIVLHNLPEGIITFLTSSLDKSIGINLAFTIAIHNILEGISISIPIFYSTKSYKKTFIYLLISALSEPLGGLISYFLFKDIISNFFIGLLLSIVSGIMIYISVFTLYSYINKNKKNYLLIAGGFILLFLILLIQ
jgi:ZIP family zinc transporter